MDTEYLNQKYVIINPFLIDINMSDNQDNEMVSNENAELSHDTNYKTLVVENTMNEEITTESEPVTKKEDEEESTVATNELNLTEVAPEPEKSSEEPTIIETPNIVVSNTEETNGEGNETPIDSEAVERPRTPDLPPRSPAESPTLPPRSPIETRAAPHLPPRSPRWKPWHNHHQICRKGMIPLDMRCHLHYPKR